jgi:hypothetical protein
MIYNRVCMIFTCQSIHTTNQIDVHCIVRDSSAVRRLFVQLAGAVWRQGALHKENSGFADPTLDRHISTFRGYRILFPIQNPYLNRFTNTFSIHSWPSYPKKVVLHSITARSFLRPYYFAISLSFSNICHVTSRKLRLPQCIMGDELHIWSYLVQKCKMRGGGRNTCSFRSQWVTLPFNLFFPTHFVLFPSALIWTVDGTVCPAEYALYRLPCDFYVAYVCK